MLMGKSGIADMPATDEENGTRLRRPEYSRPSLRVYGSVGELTMGNNGTCADGGGQNDQNCQGGNIPSDRSIKENIIRIGDHPIGIGLYLFDYKPEFRDAHGHGRQFGVMADEVETVMPEAVSHHTNGYKTVDYGLLGITQTRH